MARRSLLILLCALALIALATGCGSSASPTAAKPTTSNPSTTTAPAIVPLSVKLREAVAACKKEIAASPYIPASERPSGYADCNGVKTGQIGPLRQILKKACEQEVLTKVPAAQQQAAMTACKKVY